MIIQMIKAKYVDGRPRMEWRFHTGSARLSRVWTFSDSAANYKVFKELLSALSTGQIPSEFAEVQYDLRDDSGRTYSIELSPHRTRISSNGGPRQEGVNLDNTLREIWGNGVGLTNLGTHPLNVRHFIQCKGNPPYAIRFEELGTNGRLIAEWLDNELEVAARETQSLVVQERVGFSSYTPVNDIGMWVPFFQELEEHWALNHELQNAYRNYEPASFSLESLQEKREKLRQDVLDLDKIESTLSSVVYHSRLLLSSEEEALLQSRIAANLKNCELSAPPTIEDLESWSDLIRILGEIKFAEKILQLSSRLSSSYETKVESIAGIYTHGRKNLETGMRELSESIAKLKAKTRQESEGKGWKNIPNLMRKALEPTLPSELIEVLEEIDGKFKSLLTCLPDDKEFAGPLLKLGDFQEEQKKNLTALKEKWKTTTKIPLKEGFSDFFLYGLQHFELIWYNHLLTENRRIREQADRKIDFLRELVSKHPEEGEFDLKDVEHVLKYAQVLVNVKGLKIKKLQKLEERIIKLQVRAEIRAELMRKKEELLKRWHHTFQSRSLVPVPMEGQQALTLLEHSRRIKGLNHLREHCVERFEIFTPSITPTAISTWSLYDSTFSESDRHYLLNRLSDLSTSQLMVIASSDSQILSHLQDRSSGWIENSRGPAAEKSAPKPDLSPSPSKKVRVDRIVNLLNGRSL